MSKLGHMTVRASRFRLFGLVLLGASAVVFAGCVNHGSDDVPPTQDSRSPEAVVGRFFHWYASERNLGRDPIVSGSLDGNADVTPEFRQALKAAAAGDQPGVDPMLCSPSIPHEFEVGKAEVSGTSARVTVGAETHPMAWRAELTQEGSVWRIQAVRCVVG
jgi:hypothetical protein